MSIALICECGRHFEAPDTNVGHRVRCPGCGYELFVPKLSLPLEDEWLPFQPQLTTTSTKAIASLCSAPCFSSRVSAVCLRSCCTR